MVWIVSEGILTRGEGILMEQEMMGCVELTRRESKVEDSVMGGGRTFLGKGVERMMEILSMTGACRGIKC